MPTDFVCTQCSLRFSVGWFHYHGFASGYGSQTLLVCTQCGTQHAIEIALSDRGPELFEYRDIVLTAVSTEERLVALQIIRQTYNCTPGEAKRYLDDVPITLKRRLSRYGIQDWKKNTNTSGVSFDFPVVDTEPNKDYGPIQNDTFLGAGRPNLANSAIELRQLNITQPLRDGRSIDISIQVCSSCAGIGTLTSEFCKSLHCPHCRQLALHDLGFWIT